VLVICNLSSASVDFTMNRIKNIGMLQEIFSGTRTAFNRKNKISLGPWQYFVFVNPGFVISKH